MIRKNFEFLQDKPEGEVKVGEEQDQSVKQSQLKEMMD